jgi:hypothetical protein
MNGYEFNFRALFGEIIKPTFKLTNFSTGTTASLRKHYE